MSEETRKPDQQMFYERPACQEEIYLETVEEEERARLFVSASETCVVMPGPRVENLSEELNNAAEELITGDSDDPPLSGIEIARMLKAG